MFTITRFQPRHQDGINDMMQDIAAEFEQAISLPASQIPELLKKMPAPYWVAECGGKIAGTAGLAYMQEKNVALRRMFLRKEHRGSGLAQTLIQMCIDHARQNGARAIYLGTMAQFKAAQRFYERNHFLPIPRPELPADFPLNPIDTFFYQLSI